MVKDGRKWKARRSGGYLYVSLAGLHKSNNKLGFERC